LTEVVSPFVEGGAVPGRDSVAGVAGPDDDDGVCAGGGACASVLIGPVGVDGPVEAVAVDAGGVGAVAGGADPVETAAGGRTGMVVDTGIAAFGAGGRTAPLTAASRFGSICCVLDSCL
jgi:hypothetical protein